MPRTLLALALVLVAPAAFAQAPPACTLDATELPFHPPLTLLHALPAPGALAEYPFADVNRAARIQVALPAGDGATLPAVVTLETAAVRLRGVTHAASIRLFSARPAAFGGVLIPLAHHPLRVTAVAPGGVTVAPHPMARIHHALPPERRACDELRLRPADPFGRAALGAGASARRVPTPRGVWSFYGTADARAGSRAQVSAAPGDVVWLLEAERPPWRRVLWVTEDVALLGWTRPPHAPQGFGGATGTGTRGGFSWATHPTRCPHELTLFADDRGVVREIGVVRAGAPFTALARVGERTRVTVYDRDVTWADGVAYLVPTAQLSGCAAR